MTVAPVLKTCLILDGLSELLYEVVLQHLGPASWLS